MIKMNSKTLKLTYSKWVRHVIGKEPVYIEIVELDESVSFMGFTGLQPHSIKIISGILQREGIVPRIFYQPKGYHWRMVISVKPIPAWVARQFCSNVLAESRQGISLSGTNYFPRYSNRKSALKNRTTSPNYFVLPMYKRELVLTTLPPVKVDGIYSKWLLAHLSSNIDFVPEVINDLSKYREMYEQDEAVGE